MATERSDQAYWAYLDAQNKFDYFITGLAFAIVGYLGTTLRISAGFETLDLLEPAAALIVLGSGVAGLKRIESTLQILRGMQRRLYSEEGAGSLAAAGPGSLLNKSTGHVFLPHEAYELYLTRRAEVEVAREHINKEVGWSYLWYQVRNGLLIGGLIVLVVARVLPAVL